MNHRLLRGRRFVAAAGLALATLTATPAFAEDRALLVGIGRYRQPDANLPGIDKDVAMMRETVRLLGFRDAQVKVLADEDATLAGMERAFQSWLVDGVGPGDRILFYFSGHGSRVPDRNGDEPDGLDEILVPHDFSVTSGDPTNVLLDDVLGQWLARVPTRRALVLIDACHSGSATRSWVADKFLPYRGMPPLPKGKSVARRDLDLGDKNPSEAANYVAVSAADDTEVAQASEAGSYFTQGVLKAVRDSVSAGQPLSMLRIKDVSTQVVLELARGGRAHRPQISGDLARGGENILGSPAAPLPPPPPMPPPAPGMSLWSMLESLVDRLLPERRLSQGTNQASYRPGDALQISLDVPIDGYLNVFNVGEAQDEVVVLYPNRFQPENKVRTGDRIRIPAGAEFRLPAQLPSGRSEEHNLLVVVVTPHEVNAFRSGSGAATLRELTRQTTRAFTVEAGTGDYYAGKTITVIRK